MNLTQEPEIVNWPETHYVFLESIGPFMETAPRTWQQFHAMQGQISESNKITKYLTLYKRGPKIFRAGVAIAEAPKNIVAPLRYEKFPGGKYSKFVLTGSYVNLPAASQRVFEIVAERKIQMRDDFCIENYANDPRSTPEAELITEILIPTV